MTMQTMPRLVVAVGAVALAVAVMAAPAQAPPVDDPPVGLPPPLAQTDVYAAKFLCGSFLPHPQPGSGFEGPVKPGNYQTAINVHNPNGSLLAFKKKAVLLFRADQQPSSIGHEIPMPPGQRVAAALEPDWGLEIDCQDIRVNLLKLPASTTFIKGFVVIEVSGSHKTVPPLDVVAAYTAHGFTDPSGIFPEGFALHIDRVIPNRRE